MWREEPREPSEGGRVWTARAGVYLLVVGELSESGAVWHVGEGPVGTASPRTGIASDAAAAKRAAVAEARGRLDGAFRVYAELAAASAPPRWRPDADPLGPALRATVGPFALTARQDSYLVAGGGWAAHGVAHSVEHAKARAVEALGARLRRPDADVPGYRVDALLAELARLAPEGPRPTEPTPSGAGR